MPKLHQWSLLCAGGRHDDDDDDDVCVCVADGIVMSSNEGMLAFQADCTTVNAACEEVTQ